MTLQEFIEKSSRLEHDYEVSPETYYAFQRCSGDYNPLHTDEAFAAGMGFGQRVMYGNILNAFVSHFVGMLLPSRHVMIQAQDIKFRRPVFLNDTIRLEATVEQVSEAVSSVIYKLRFVKTSSTGGGKPTLVANGHVQIGFMEGGES